MAMRQPGPGLSLGLGQALGCCSATGVCNPIIACPAPSQDGLNPQNCPDLPGTAAALYLLAPTTPALSIFLGLKR